MKPRDDIRDELKNIAPALSELTPTNPFDVPQGYFDALPGDVLNNVKRQNGLVESLKSERAVTNPFDVPAGYFDALPQTILERATSEPKVIEMTTVRWKGWLSVAAAVAAVVMAAVPMLQKSNVQTTTEVLTADALEKVSSDELYAYLSDDVSAWHVDDVAAGIADARLDTMERELVAAQTTAYDDALLDISQLDIESINIESL
jgi:hypothetical protein